MQPKFITFIQCTLEYKCKHAAGSDAGQEENMAMRNMTVFRSTDTDAKINLVYMSLKEVRLQFEQKHHRCW